MKGKKNKGIKIRLESEVTTGPMTFRKEYTSKKLITSPSQVQIIGRRIENEGTLDPDKLSTSNSKPLIVFTARSRSKSTDLRGRVTSPSVIKLERTKKLNTIKKNVEELMRKFNLIKARRIMQESNKLKENIDLSESVSVNKTTKRIRKLSTHYDSAKLKDNELAKQPQEVIQELRQRPYFQLKDILKESIKKKTVQRGINKVVKGKKRNSKNKEPHQSTRARRSSQEQISIKTTFKADKEKLSGGVGSGKTLSGSSTVRLAKQENRISALGLGILYMKKGESKKVTAKSKENIPVIKKSSTRKNIKDYIVQKKDEWNRKRRDKENEEKSKKERIDANKVKLNTMIKFIFGTAKKGYLQGKKNKRKASKGKRKVSEEKYFSIEPNKSHIRIRSMSSSECSQSGNTIKKMKEQLIREMKSRVPTDATGIHKFINTSHNKPETKMSKSQSQPYINKNPLPDEEATFLTQKPSSETSKLQSRDTSTFVNATKIQAMFRGYLVRKEMNKILSVQLEGLESRLQEDKIVHCSHITSVEDYESPNKRLRDEAPLFNSIATNTENPVPDQYAKKLEKIGVMTVNPVEEVNILPKETQDIISIKPLSKTGSSLELVKRQKVGFRLMKSENASSDSLDLTIEKNLNLPKPESIFERNTFQAFTLRKYGSRTAMEHLSRILSTQEKIIKYREKTEKMYLRNMYKNKKYSSQTYQRKRKELEKWINKEQDEIRNSKAGLMNTFQRTANMIEEAHCNALRIKKFFMQHALSYNSDSAISISADIQPGLEKLNAEKNLDKEDVKEIYNVQDKLSANKVSPTKRKEVKLEITDLGVIGMEPVIKKEVSNSPEESNTSRDVEEIKPLIELMKVSESKEIYIEDNKPQIVEDIVSEIYTDLVNNTMECLNTVERKPSEVQPTKAQIQSFLKNLATKKHKGIKTNIYQINDYMNELLHEVFSTQQDSFITSISQPIIEDPFEVLKRIQSADKEYNVDVYEMYPVLQLDTYLELEKKHEASRGEEEGENETQELLEECEHIHNKAIFDVTNEALAMMRPYGIAGQPMPWSLVPRILVSKIFEPAEIIRKVKSIVLEWANSEAGTLPQMAFMVGDRFDEECFSEVREKKLVSVLAQEVLESEGQWTRYDSEEAEVSIDLSDMVMDQLVYEAVAILNKAS